jgi:hypothetical protein
MANNYSRGTSNNIIVGAAALFTYNDSLDGAPGTGALPSFVAGESYKDTLSASDSIQDGFTNVGYTSNGIELQFQPDFGEVQVDQVLDVARLFKQGMKVSLATSFAEATLENLVVSIAANDTAKSTLATGTGIGAGSEILDLQSGELGEVPLERGIIAVGPGTGNPAEDKERIYIGYRALSIENVTVSAKRDAASMFDVSFRMLPIDNGSYGKIVDRVIA